MNPQHITSSTDGLELAYWLRRANHASAKHLFLIHGGASNHTRWSEFAEQTTLARTWDVAVADMRGNGESMTRGRQNMSTWCADLLDIFALERFQDPVIAGHSLGAQIAVHFAQRNPSRTRGLILLDPVFQSSLRGRQRTLHRLRWPARALVVVIRALNACGIRRRRILNRDLRELDRETRAAIAGDETFAEIAKRYAALGPILQHMPTANYLRQALETVRPLPPLEDIKVPVLALLSGGTTVANHEQNRIEIARIKDSEVVTLAANHWPLTETPDAVREAVDEWVLRKFP